MARIIIDFDGTCVTHDFPEIGKEIGAAQVLSELIENGHQLFLSTMRSDYADNTMRAYLTEAVKWFQIRKIPLSGINENPNQKSWTSSPKIDGDICIDDRNIGCPVIFKPEIHSKEFVDWGAVRELLIQKGYLR